MIFWLEELPAGVEALPGHRVVYDLARNEAHFGGVALDGPALVWEVAEHGGEGSKLAAEVSLDPATPWLVRCDRIDFPRGVVAYRHTHPGPGIRYLLHGTIRIETGSAEHTYGPRDAWFESGPEPVLAHASAIEPTAFVRVLLLPQEWEGKRTIHYVDPADEQKPKLQRPTVFFDVLVNL